MQKEPGMCESCKSLLKFCKGLKWKSLEFYTTEAEQYGIFNWPDVQTIAGSVMLHERQSLYVVILKSNVMVNDAELEKRVHEEISKEPLLGKNEIVVEADDGVVTLSGIVETQDLKIRAKTIAQNVPEVISVVELLDVKPPLPSEEDMTKSTFGQEENIIADTAEKKLKISGA